MDGQTATPKEQFDILYERLRFYHDSAIDAVFKVTASLLVVIGWLVTSETTRKVIAGNAMIRWCAAVAILLFAVQFIGGALRSTARSQRIAAQLQALAYMPNACYADIVLQRGLALGFILMSSALCAVALVLIL